MQQPAKKSKIKLCAPPDTNGARAYREADQFEELPRDANNMIIKYGMHVSIDGHGSWRVIDIHPESGDIGLDTEDGILYIQRSRVRKIEETE